MSSSSVIDRVEDSGGQLADVDRHKAAPGWGRGQCAGQRGLRPGAQRTRDGTHLVVDLVRGATHGDAGSAAELNHDRHGSPFPAQIPAPRSGISPTVMVNFVHRFDWTCGTWRPAKSIAAGAAVGSLADPCGCRRCSCARCATTRPTPRSTATGCWSGRATSAGSPPASTPGCRSGYRVLRKVSEIVREEMDRAGAQEVLAADRPAARALGAQRPQRRRTAT